MSLQNTTLPDFVLAGLFRTNLITLPPESGQQARYREEAVSVPISYLGENADSITIGVHIEGHANLPPDLLTFLVNVLKACQRNTDHVAIVNFAACDPQLSEIITQLHPRLIMLFGSSPLFETLSPGQEDFSVAEVKQVRIVRLPGIDRLMETTAESKQLKGRLWLILKQFFNL